MEHIVFKTGTANETIFLHHVEQEGTAATTTDEAQAQVFDSLDDALNCIKIELTGEPDGFWGARPTRPR